MITHLLTLFAVSPGCESRLPKFFGLKPWYYYLDTNDLCEVQNFKVLDPSGSSDFLLIALAIADDLLRIAGLVAIAFIIYGGFLYMSSQGSPDQTQKAQNTIQNSLIGLVVALLAIATVSFLGSRIG